MSSAQAVEFYGFLKPMETYKTVLSGNSLLVVSTDSDLFRLLKSTKSSAPPVSVAPPSPPLPAPAAP